MPNSINDHFKIDWSQAEPDFANFQDSYIQPIIDNLQNIPNAKLNQAFNIIQATNALNDVSYLKQHRKKLAQTFNTAIMTTSMVYATTNNPNQILQINQKVIEKLKIDFEQLISHIHCSNLDVKKIMQAFDQAIQKINWPINAINLEDATDFLELEAQLFQYFTLDYNDLTILNINRKSQIKQVLMTYQPQNTYDSFHSWVKLWQQYLKFSQYLQNNSLKYLQTHQCYNLNTKYIKTYLNMAELNFNQESRLRKMRQ